MEIIAFIIALIAVFVFALVAANKPSRWNLLGVGLALLTAAWVIQLVTSGHQVHT